nr:gliding motility-associated C-terminal domain-containing protein [Saprospiraceae bacterium]
MRILQTLACLILVICTYGLSAQPTFNISSASAQNGETVVLDVTVDDFNNMFVANFSIQWDIDVMEFEGLTNLNNAAQITMGMFGTPLDSLGAKDLVNFGGSWPEVGGIDLADGTRLFSIEFLLVGEPCSNTDVVFTDGPTAIEIIQEIEEPIDVTDQTTFNDGFVQVQGVECDEPSGDIEFFGTTETAGPGDEVCVGIGVRNFVDVLSMQYSHNWNTDLLEFIEVRNLNLTGLNNSSFETSQAVNGRIGMSHSTGSLLTVPDNTIIYELCFEVKGNIGQTAFVNFSSDPVIVDVVSEDAQGNAVELDPEFTSGRVNIAGEFDGLSFIAGNIIGPFGQEVCIDVNVTGFDNILGFEKLRFEWDPNAIDFQSVESVDLPPSAGFNDLNVGDGELLALWVDDNADGVTLADNTIAFRLCFEVIGECESVVPLVVTGENGDIMAFDGDGQDVPAQGIDGSIQIECGCDISGVITDANCFGEATGSIDIELSVICEDFESLTWEGPSNIADGELNPTGLLAGTYTVTVVYGGGDSEEASFEVGQGDEIIIDDIVVNLPSPPGTATGSIEVVASGGTGELDYDWGDALPSGALITDLEAGEYQVTITDELGCQIVSEVIVLCGIPVTMEVFNVTCTGDADGSIQFTVDEEGLNLEFSYSCDESASGPSVSGLSPGECTITVTDLDQNCSIVFEAEITEAENLLEIRDIVVVDDDEGTSDGSISVTVVGGVTPYTFNWSHNSNLNSPNATGLEGGNYTLEVIDDNGCTREITVAVGGALEPGANINHVACRGESTGRISLNVAGGSGDYTYQWICSGGQSGTEQTISNLSAGTCVVTITDNDSGVQLIDSFVVSEPALDLNFEVMSLECNEETNRADLVLLATGGVAPYSFSVGPNQFQTTNRFNSLLSGTEMVFVRDDAGCEKSLEIEIPNCIFDDCFEGRLVITPNGDGLNDNLVIKCVQNTQNILRIFNRGGQLVYQEANYRNTWEGTNNSGSDLNEDSYMWVLEVFEASGGREIYRGTVTLLRGLR